MRCFEMPANWTSPDSRQAIRDWQNKQDMLPRNRNLKFNEDRYSKLASRGKAGPYIGG